mgnify:CR=1 FL=1
MLAQYIVLWTYRAAVTYEWVWQSALINAIYGSKSSSSRSCTLCITRLLLKQISESMLLLLIVLLRVLPISGVSLHYSFCPNLAWPLLQWRFALHYVASLQKDITSSHVVWVGSCKDISFQLNVHFQHRVTFHPRIPNYKLWSLSQCPDSILGS